jgi:hypothetical protein
MRETKLTTEKILELQRLKSLTLVCEKMTEMETSGGGTLKEY